MRLDKNIVKNRFRLRTDRYFSERYKSESLHIDYKIAEVVFIEDRQIGGCYYSKLDKGYLLLESGNDDLEEYSIYFQASSKNNDVLDRTTCLDKNDYEVNFVNTTFVILKEE